MIIGLMHGQVSFFGFLFLLRLIMGTKRYHDHGSCLSTASSSFPHLLGFILYSPAVFCLRN